MILIWMSVYGARCLQKFLAGEWIDKRGVEGKFVGKSLVFMLDIYVQFANKSPISMDIFYALSRHASGMDACVFRCHCC